MQASESRCIPTPKFSNLYERGESEPPPSSKRGRKRHSEKETRLSEKTGGYRGRLVQAAVALYADMAAVACELAKPDAGREANFADFIDAHLPSVPWPWLANGDDTALPTELERKHEQVLHFIHLAEERT